MKQIKLSNGYCALVDDEDFEMVSKYKWQVYKSGNVNYATSRRIVNKKIIRFRMHRLVMGLTDPKIIIDHKDLNGLNNQKSNLRICNASQNAMNRRSVSGKTSKYKGVFWDKEYERWGVSLRKNNKTIFFKRFDNEIDAAIEYNKQAVIFFGDFARLNTIEYENSTDKNN